MAKIIGLPDGTEGEFPDSMSDDEIATVLRKQFPPTKPAPKASDFYDTAASVPMQFLGGAKHAWDRAAAGLESLVPGGKQLSKALGQPDLQQLKESGKQFVDETGPASSLGEFAGEVGLTAAPGTAAFNAVNRLSRAAPMLNRTIRYLGGGAAAGGAGALTMGDNVGEGAGVGAAVGAGLPIVGIPLSGAIRMGQNAFAGPAGMAVRQLRETFGDRTNDVIAALRRTRGMVPGEQPTAGLAAVDRQGVISQLKTLEEAARTRGTAADQFANRDVTNAAARMGVLDDMASPIREEVVDGVRQLSPAAALRRQVTDPLYRRAGQTSVPVDDTLAAQLVAPEALPASRRGAESFNQARANGTAGPDPTPAYVPEPPLPPNAFGMVPEQAPTPFMPQAATRSIDDLQRTKNALTEEIKGLGTSGEAGLQRAQLMRVRSNLNNAMQQSGDYQLANDVFRTYSAPINQGEIADVLANALRKPGTSGERLSSFSTAVQNAPATIKKAGGDPRFQQLGEVMSPEQMRQINALRGSVSRQAEYDALNAGRNAVPEHNSIPEQIEGWLPGIFNRYITAGRGLLKRAAGISDEQVQNVVDQAMLDPNAVADLLERLPPDQRSAVMNVIRQQLPRAQGAISGYAGQLGAE